MLAQPSIEWNSQKSIRVERAADLLKKIHLNMKVGPAPAGYRWKRCWPFHFVKDLEVQIGGLVYWKTGTNTLQMEHLMHGLQRYPDWLASMPRVPAEELAIAPESVFDYGEEERARLSRESHEVSFEPLSLKHLVQLRYGLPILALQYHDVKLQITTASVADCLEPIDPGTVTEPHAELQKCEFVFEMDFLDTEERRHVARIPHEFVTKHMEYTSGTFDLTNEREIQTWIKAYTNCSAVSLWITDEQDREIPSQVVEEFSVLFNGQERHRLSGYQSRFDMRDQLPFPTLNNTKSQNLYYISYYSGRTEQSGLEQGANFSEIDRYELKIRCREGIQQRIKIHMLHRAQNFCRIMSGMCGIVYTNHGFRFLSEAPQPRPVVPIVPRSPQTSQTPATLLVFPNTDQLIEIHEEDNVCPITYEEFKEGDLVQQCLECKKVMSSAAMDTWFSQPANQYNKKCVHCRQPYSLTTFRKGKAHLVREITDTQPFLIPYNRESLLQKFLHAIGIRQRARVHAE